MVLRETPRWRAASEVVSPRRGADDVLMPGLTATAGRGHRVAMALRRFGASRQSVRMLADGQLSLTMRTGLCHGGARSRPTTEGLHETIACCGHADRTDHRCNRGDGRRRQ